MSRESVSPTKTPPLPFYMLQTPPRPFLQDDEQYDIPILPDSIANELIDDNHHASEDTVSNSQHAPDTFVPKSPLTHSKTTQKYLGKRTPHNTIRTSNTALNAFFKFVYESQKPHTETNELYGTLNKTKRRKIDNDIAHTYCLSYFFLDSDGTHFPKGFTEWPNSTLLRLKHHLIEFVINYKSQETSQQLKPSSMKTYILGIQRGLLLEYGYEIKLLQGPIFNDPENGLFVVANNKFSEQQFEGSHVRSHNVLSRDDVKKLYQSASLNKFTPGGFQARLVFDVGLISAMRTTALHELKMTNFRKGFARGENVWILTETIGSTTGASKTTRGGWNSISTKPSQVTIWNRPVLNGELNIYEDIDKYMQMRAERGKSITTERFFLAINSRATSFKLFFKNGNLGKNTMSAIVKSACVENGIQGVGENVDVTLHGLRATVTSLLFEKGHADSSVALRTGHRDMKSLKSYHNLQGDVGLKQQEDLFSFEEAGGSEEKKVNTDNEKTTAQLDQDVKRSVGTNEESNPVTVCPSFNDVSGGTFNITINVTREVTKGGKE